MVEKGIFVTRVKPRTTIKDIQNLVKDETGIFVHVEKLKPKYDTYSSFYIPCTRKVIRELLKESIWPAGVLVRVYENIKDKSF